jgi:predicted transcriptional regulator
VGENADIVEAQADDFIELTADLVSAYVSNNHLLPSEISTFIADTHAALARLSKETAPEAPKGDKPIPAQIRKSVTPDALISFVDGKPYKTLRRHLTKSG